MTTKLSALGRPAVVLSVIAAVVSWAPPAVGAAPAPMCFNKPATIIGTNGPDHLTGTQHRDVIVGLGGNDTISGLGGDDLLCAGAGDDVIRGGPGKRGVDSEQTFFAKEFLSGGPGRDVLYGGAGPDFLRGDAGPDRLYGNTGFDVLGGGAGQDELLGGKGTDELDGGPGADVGSGGDGGDSIFERGATDGVDAYRLNAGNDVAKHLVGDNLVYGGGGNDRLHGGVGADRLFGGPGNDGITGAAGNDRIRGSKGRDTAHFPAVTDGSTSLTVDLAAGTATGAGNDTLSGIEDVTANVGPNVLLGDSGPNMFTENVSVGSSQFTNQDVVNGRGGSDTFKYDEPGGPGCRATIDLHKNVATCFGASEFGHPTAHTKLQRIENATGATEADVLVGDAGANVLRGDKGADVLRGLGGNDQMYGGGQYFRHEKHAADHLNGGAGKDLCRDPDHNTTYRHCER